MKCLVLACEYLPTNGGIAHAAHRFAQQMSARGVHVHVCSGVAIGADVRVENLGGISVTRYRIDGDVSAWDRPRGEIAEFLSFVRRYSPDWIVIHGWQGWPIALFRYYMEMGIPVVLQSHGFGAHRIHWRWKPPFGLKVWAGYIPFLLGLPGLIRRLAALVVLDKYPNPSKSFDHWIGRLFCHNKVVTIPNAVESIQRRLVDRWDDIMSLRDRRIVLCVANYCERKNQMFGLRVAESMKDDDVHFVFLGDDANSYYMMLKEYCEQRDLSEKVSLWYGRTREFCEALIQRCDLAMMCSTFEMQPLFLLESMACARPWVSTDVGCVKEFLGGKMLPLKVESFRDAIKRILGSADLAGRMGQFGKTQWQEEFATEKVYGAWCSLLKFKDQTNVGGDEQKN